MADAAGSGRVRIEEGVVFGTAATGTQRRELRCDLFYPPEPGTQRPAVVLIHGGAWYQGDRSQLRSYGIQLGKRGYVCAAIEYRLSGEAKWPAQLHDVKAALRFMHAKSAELGVDPRKICVSGNSAGGHLALLLAATRNQPELDGDGGHAGASTDCAACIAFYAPTQLGGPNPSGPVRALFPEGDQAEARSAASPLEHASADFPPTLLLHGNRDALVPQAASLEMYSALSAKKAPVELHIYNGAEHGFDVRRDLFRHCVEVMTLFLDRHIQPQRAQADSAARAAAVPSQS
jgi:acetyl esterase/lipase